MYCLAARASTLCHQNSCNDYLFLQKTASSEYVSEKLFLKICLSSWYNWRGNITGSRGWKFMEEGTWG